MGTHPAPEVNMLASPIQCRLAYQWALQRYFPRERRNYGEQKFKAVSELLTKEKIRADRWFMFWLSSWSTKKYKSEDTRVPTPKQLADPKLVADFRRMNG